MLFDVRWKAPLKTAESAGTEEGGCRGVVLGDEEGYPLETKTLKMKVKLSGDERMRLVLCFSRRDRVLFLAMREKWQMENNG